MANDEITGLIEEFITEIDQDNVTIRKRYTRKTEDAALPPGQSIEFEFVVAAFPIKLYITSRNVTRAITLEPAIPDQNQFDDAPPPRPPVILTGIQKAPVSQGGIVINPGLFDPGGDFPPPVQQPQPPPSPGTGGGGGPIDDPIVPFEIILTPPNGKPEIGYYNSKLSELRTWPNFENLPVRIHIDPEGLEGYKGKWKISVKNINDVAKLVKISLSAPFALTKIHTRDFPLALVNRLTRAAIRKSLPAIFYSDGKLIVSLENQLAALLGTPIVDLDSLAGSIIKKIPSFQPLHFSMMSLNRFLILLGDRKAELNRLIDNELNVIKIKYGSDDYRVTNLVMKKIAINNLYNEKIESIQIQRNPPIKNRLCMVFEGLFSKDSVDLLIVGKVADIRNELPQIALIFDETLKPIQVITTISVDLSPIYWKVGLSLFVVGGVIASSPLLSLLALVGFPLIATAAFMALFGFGDEDYVENSIKEGILTNKEIVSHYLKGFLGRMVSYQAVVEGAQVFDANDNSGNEVLKTRFYSITNQNPPMWHRPDLNLNKSLNVDALIVPEGMIDSNDDKAIFSLPASSSKKSRTLKQTSFKNKIPGDMPSDFIVNNPETLSRLDSHDSIVVIMMENRSFDHYFYELASKFPDKGYSMPPPGFSNIQPAGFGYPINALPRESIGLGHTLYYRSGRHLDPSHSFEHVLNQIGGGLPENVGTGDMNGFARDFAKKSDSPQIAMSYFGLDDLPVYKALAQHYPVCDRWFCALPAGTYPNRLAALQGNVPFLHNVPLDDPSLGYIKDYSIPDLFNEQGISWMCFESDFSTLRLYDRYRLEIDKIKPIEELDNVLKSGVLPRLMMIEPQFAYGNDDHPPLDIRRGQYFIKQVLQKFIDNNVLSRVLFVITYDEHGGFFDHIAPPGTSKGPAEWLGRVPKLHPQGPDFMGVRVPSLLLSPYTEARAEHAVFDHTSLVKTILLHNRSKIATEQFSYFGNRVKMISHLGQALVRSTPRTIDYQNLLTGANFKTSDIIKSPFVDVIIDSRMAGLTRDHPGMVLQELMTPRARVFKSKN